MTVEELTEIFAKRDAELAAQNAEYIKRFAEQGDRIDKLAIIVAETSATVNKLSDRVDKLDARVDKLADRVDKLADRVDKLAITVAETSATVARTEKLVGNLTNKFGDFFERLMIPGIIEKFNEKGFSFDKISTNVEFLKDKDGSTITEVDAILENGKYVVLIETKSDLRNKHIKEHLKSIALLRKNGKFKGKRIYGAISCGYARKPTLEYGLKSGLFMLCQPDSFAVEIADFPKGYSAKTW